MRKGTDQLSNRLVVEEERAGEERVERVLQHVEVGHELVPGEVGGTRAAAECVVKLGARHAAGAGVELRLHRQARPGPDVLDLRR